MKTIKNFFKKIGRVYIKAIEENGPFMYTGNCYVDIEMLKYRMEHDKNRA